jgi:two-component SAPR family response regulator
VEFPRAKTKELLAYLIDRRGGSASIEEMLGVLWEDSEANDSRKSQLRTQIAELKSILKEHGASDWIIKGRGRMAIQPNLVNCDYYSFLNGNVEALNYYMGEYMSQYSWAEMTNGWLYGKLSGKH